MRVIAELASKTERSRRLEQQREEERRARARAKDAHRAAVRANAERVAQEKQAALARKMEVERLRLLKVLTPTLTLLPEAGPDPILIVDFYSCH